MDKLLKEEISDSIELIRQSTKYNMETSLECYSEIISKLDLLSYLLIEEK